MAPPELSWLRTFASGAAFLLLSGCAAYRAQPISPVREAANFNALSLRDTSLRDAITRATGHPPRSWNSVTLTEAAVLLHPDMELARAELQTARAAIGTASQSPNPTLGSTGQLTANNLGGMPPWTFGLNLDIPFETAGKRTRRVEQATAVARAAALRIRNTAWQVRSLVRKSLLDWYAASRRRDLFRAEQQTQEETLKTLNERIAAGDISRPEELQTRLLYNQSQLLLRDAERQQAEARAALAGAIGVPTSAIESLTLDPSEFEKLPRPGAAEQLRRTAMLHRADVLAALADYAASEAALHLEVAKQYPDIRLNPGFAFDQGQSKWDVIPAFELPIRNHNQGQIAEAHGKRAEAAAKFRSTQEKAANDVERALASFTGSWRKLDTANALLASQEKQRSSAEALLKAGETDRLSLLAAQVELDSIRVARLDSLVELQHAAGQLESAAQTLIK